MAAGYSKTLLFNTSGFFKATLEFCVLSFKLGLISSTAYQGCMKDVLVGGGKYCAESLLTEAALKFWELVTQELSWVEDYRQSNITSQA